MEEAVISKKPEVVVIPARYPFLARNGKPPTHRLERDGENYLSVHNNVLSAAFCFSDKFFRRWVGKQLRVVRTVLAAGGG